MEITSFAFGMLAMIALTLVIVVVVGMVRVNKMKETLNHIERYLENNNRDLHERITREVGFISKEMDRNMSSSEQVFKNFESHITTVSDEKERRIEELYRYVDSRFDKMENKFVLNNKVVKQVIND